MVTGKALPTLIGVALVLVAGCGSSGDAGGGGKQTPGKAYAPSIDPADFTTEIDNKYFPLEPGTTFVYRGETRGATDGDTVRVTSHTKNVMGVTCEVVEDRVTEDGELTEKTYDWHAKDERGNVWYFGEDSREYENGKVESTEGSWEAGKDGAKPGIIMPADPKVGEAYPQEYYESDAEDMARAIVVDGSAKVPYGSFDNVLVTDEWTPLEKNVAEHKFYAPGVGNVKEIAKKGPRETLELVDVKHD